MKNEAISAMLDYLCNEARNSVHASFGLLGLLREGAGDPEVRNSVAIGGASADQLLLSIDDFRELVADTPRTAAIEDFDLGLCVGQIAEMLNLTSENSLRRMTLDTPIEPLRMRQDRTSVEQAITRVLDAAMKLSESLDVNVSLYHARREEWTRLAVASDDPALAIRLNSWLNADVKQADLADDGDVQYGVSVMVAAKRLRALGGTALLAEDSAGRPAVALDIPSLVADVNGAETQIRPDCLNILVAEDHDESFALTALALEDEQVWRAHDGDEALQMMQTQRFDVVFVDVHMPRITGYEAIRNMRDWETRTGSARTPMVILSSDDLDTQRRSAAEFGCSGFLRKPLRRLDLEPLLDRLR